MEREIRGKEKSGEEGKRKKEERREREGGEAAAFAVLPVQR